MPARVGYVLVCWLLTLVVPALANESWVEIGSAKARVSENTLTIFPKDDLSYSKLRFHIANGDVFVNQALVYLVKGSVFHINLQTNLRANDYDNGILSRVYSRIIPLVSSQQVPIKKVKVFYTFKRQQSPTQPVTLTLFGVPTGAVIPLKNADS